MNAIIAFALKQRVFLAILLPLILIGGFALFSQLNIEAYPDPVPPLVDIVTQSSGQSAEEIERYITIPIEIQMAGIPHVTAVRTISLFGLSDVKVQFTYDFTYQEAEQWVINRLSQLPNLANGATPQISPTSPIGEIYRYRVAGPKGYSSMDLKTLEDWVLERRFKAVPGVIDVTGWGGKTKTYEVSVDQHRVLQYGLSLGQVLQALNNSNVNVGGQTVNIGPQAAVVRGVGLIHSLDDIRKTMVTSAHGIPVSIGDLATVKVGNQPRLGIAGQDKDADDVVEGIVLMRRGEQSMPTIERVKAEVDTIKQQRRPAARRADRADLRPLRPHSCNDPHGVAQRTGRHLADLSIAVGLPGKSAQRADRGLYDSVRTDFRDRPDDHARRVREPVVGRRDRFRAHRRCVRDHGREYLPAPERKCRSSPDRLDHHARRPGYQHIPWKFAVIANAATEVNQAILFAAAIIIAGFVPLLR